MESQLMLKVRKLLDALGGTTGEPGDLTCTLQHVAQTAKTLFAADACIIFAINPITNHFIGSLTVAGNLLKRDNLSYKQPRPEGIAPQILKQGVLLVEDLEAAPEYHSIFTRSEGIRSFAGLALYMKRSQKPLGVLYLDFRQQQKFSTDDRELFQFFADQASFILQETWLLQRHQAVARIGEEINHELATVDILFQKLQKYLPEILDTTHALLLAVYQPQTKTLDVHLEEEGQPLQINRPLEGACKYVIETQQTLFIRQMSVEAEHLPFKSRDAITRKGSKESLIFVPLLLRDVSVGVLSIQHPQPNVYDQEDLSILELLTNHIALALHNMRLFSDLRQLNEAGQLLTQQLKSEQTLQATVDKIHEATKADVVVLYPYESARHCFALPPRIAGILHSSPPQFMSPDRPNDVAAVALQHMKPIFAKESATIYTILDGDVRIRQENFQQREKIHSTAVVPLRVGDESVGVLFINFRQTQRFDATQKLFIEGLAHYAAIAIKNAQVFGTLSLRRVRELEILQNIDRELSRALELKPVLNILLRLAHEQVSADGASILLYNPQTQALETEVAVGLHAETNRMFMIPLLKTKGITRWVLKQKKPARVDNVHLDPRWRDIYIETVADTVSELDVPLLVGDEVVGVLNFESTREAAFRQEDEDFLLTLAGQAVLAVKNAQAYEREKRLAAEAQVLNEISKEITSQLDLPHVFDLILEKALELTHSNLGNLMLYDSNQDDLWMAAERGMAEDKKGRRQRMDQGVVGYAARNKQLINANVTQQPWNEIYLEFFPGACSELAVPMLAGDVLWGVLNIESPVPNNFSESDERLLKGLAALAVVALQNAQAYEREKRLLAEAQVLNKISKEISGQLDPAHVFDLILEKALELTHSTWGTLHLYDADQNDFWMAAERGVVEDKKGQRQRLDQGVVGYAARNKQLINVADVFQLPWKEIYVEFIPGVRSEIAVPMLAGNDLRGMLNVESPLPNNFSESDERLLQGLTDMAVVALQNAQAYEREKRLVAEGQLLKEISKEITSQLDYLHVFDLILEKALELTHSTVGALLLYDPDLNDLQIVAAHGLAEDKRGVHMDLQQGIVGYVARNKHLVNADLSQLPWNEIYANLDPRNKMCSELAVPMFAGDEIRGVLNVEGPIPRNFNESDERLLQGLADLAVVALQNAQAYAREKRLVAEGQLLNEISKEITSQLDYVHVFDLIVEKAVELTHATVGGLFLYDPDLNDLQIVAAQGQAEEKRGVRMDLQQGIVGYVARNKQLVNADLSQALWKEIYADLDPGNKMCSELVVPMLAGDKIRGVLNVESPIPRNFNESDERLLIGLADLAVVALQNAERYDQAKQEVQRFELLYQAGQELGKIGDLTQLEQAYDIVLHIAEKYRNGQVVIRRYEKETQELVTMCVSHHQYFPPLPRMKLDEGINGQVARERRSIVIYDTNRPPSGVVPAKLPDLTVRSLVITPIMFKKRYYGNLGFSHKEVGHFRDADVHFLEGLTQQLASTIYRLETARERQEFEQRAISAETMSSIGQIAFELTHRWGNDLGLVRSYVNDIRSELKTLNVKSTLITEKLENIVRAAGAVLNLSKELKQALVGTGEAIVAKPVIIEPRTLLEEAQDATSLPSNIQICLEIDDDVAAVRVIHSLVVDILRNLMTNAIDAMPQGGKITLKAHNTGRFVALEVIDTGAGIPQQSLPKIFDLFYSTKGSSGFGLWSARTNALRNQGDLTVKSQEGHGTTFSLLLPGAER